MGAPPGMVATFTSSETVSTLSALRADFNINAAFEALEEYATPHTMGISLLVPPATALRYKLHAGITSRAA